MKRTAFLSTFLLVVSFGLFTACQPAADNRAVTTTATPSPEVVDTAAIETELRRIENDWPRVVREKDVAAVRRVEADDAVFVLPDGNLTTKEQDIKDMESGALSGEWQVLDLKVNVLDADAATVLGHQRVTNGKYKMPNGTTIDISGEYRFVDTFVRRNGEWKLVAGAGVKVSQPTASASPSTSPSPRVSPTTAASPAARPPAATRPSPAAAAPSATP